MPLGPSPFDTFAITHKFGNTRGADRERSGDIPEISSELKGVAVPEFKA